MAGRDRSGQKHLGHALGGSRASWEGGGRAQTTPPYEGHLELAILQKKIADPDYMLVSRSQTESNVVQQYVAAAVEEQLLEARSFVFQP